MTHKLLTVLGNADRNNKWLVSSAILWFIVATFGQGIFAFYITAYYVAPAMNGGIEVWTNTTLPKSYIPDDSLGNLAIASHLLLAAVITIGGPLQLVPQIRHQYRKFHHWNGRVYILTALVMSVSGLYLVLFRGAVGGDVQHFSLILNGLLILIFGFWTLKHAIKRNIAVHQRWALRLFLVVSGVWFARAGLWFSMFVNGGPFGFDPQTFEGPFLDFLGFAQYLIPLAILEAYFRATDTKKVYLKLSVTFLILILTVFMGIGIYAASVGMWLPRI